MAFCRLHDEYWAVNLESLGLDTLSNTETSKPCVISKHGLVVHKFNGEVTKSRPKGDDDDIEISMV